MKKRIIVILAAVVALVIGIFVRNSVHEEDALCAVTYCSHIGYSLSMAANEEQITVAYMEQDKEPIVKIVDRSCYTNIVSMMDEFDFTVWQNLSDPTATTTGFDWLEIKYKSGKTFIFSRSQDLPEKAQEMFTVINSCLLEYAGICK